MISGVGNVGDGITHCANSSTELDTWISNQGQLNLGKNDPGRYELRGKFSMTTLDSLLQLEPFLVSSGHASVGGIDFLKMDVEGFEGEVIKGGPSLLSQHKPKKIQSELWKTTNWLAFISGFV